MRFALLFPLVLLVGCGGSNPGGPKLATCFKENNTQRQIAECTEVIKTGRFKRTKLRNSVKANVFSKRGLAYLKRKRFNEALENFDRALRLTPGSADAWNNRGYIYLTRHELGPAIYDFNQAISLNPKHADAWSNRGRAHKGRGEYYRAAHDWERAIGINGEVEVRRWQNKLKELGLYNDAVDGVYNDRTWAALLACAKHSNCWP